MFTSGFFNSINSDRKYNAEQMAAIFDGLITDGIFDSIGDHFQVTPASSGLGVNIGTGRAWLNQTWSYNDTAYPVTLSAASPSLGRKDLICLKVDKSSAVRSNSLVVVTGTPAASPVEPTITDDTTNGIYYHKLAAVTVPKGATSISAANITNYIGLSAGTPYATGLLSSTTVDELWSQWDGEFNDWWDDIKATLDDNIVTTILNKIDHITPKESTMNLYGFSHIDPPPSGKTYQAYSTDAILQQVSSLLNDKIGLSDNIYISGTRSESLRVIYRTTVASTASFAASSPDSLLLFDAEDAYNSAEIISINDYGGAGGSTSALKAKLTGKYVITRFIDGSAYTSAKEALAKELGNNFASSATQAYYISGAESIYWTYSRPTYYLHIDNTEQVGFDISNDVHIQSRSAISGNLGNTGKSNGVTIIKVVTTGTGSMTDTNPTKFEWYSAASFPVAPDMFIIYSLEPESSNPGVRTVLEAQLIPNGTVFNGSIYGYKYVTEYRFGRDNLKTYCFLQNDGKTLYFGCAGPSVTSMTTQYGAIVYGIVLMNQ